MSSSVGAADGEVVVVAAPLLLRLLLRLGLEYLRHGLLGLRLRGGRFQTLGLGGKLVVLSGQEVVQVAHHLEEDVEPGLALDGPEDAPVLEPGVRKDAVEAPEDVDEALDADVLAPRPAGPVRVAEDDEAAGEQLLVGDDDGGPVEGVAAVVDGAAALGLLVDGAQELPLGGAHLGARRGAAGGGVEEEADDEGVALGDEEAAELVEP